MIYLLCDALKEFDYSSTAHFEAGYHCSARLIRRTSHRPFLSHLE